MALKFTLSMVFLLVNGVHLLPTYLTRIVFGGVGRVARHRSLAEQLLQAEHAAATASTVARRYRHQRLGRGRRRAARRPAVYPNVAVQRRSGIKALRTHEENTDDKTSLCT